MILRVEMIVLALAFIVIVFCTVNRKKLQMRYSLIWLLLSLALAVVAVFPQTAAWAASLAGIQTPANFIYLLGIFFLLILSFSLTVNLSKQADQLKRIVQVVSIDRFLRENREDRPAEKKGHER